MAPWRVVSSPFSVPTDFWLASGILFVVQDTGLRKGQPGWPF